MPIVSTSSLLFFCLFVSVHARSVGACLFNLPFPFIRTARFQTGRSKSTCTSVNLSLHHVSGSLPDVQPIAKNI